MIFPRPRATMPAPTAWLSRKTASRLTASTSRHSRRTAGASGRARRRMIPALLTRMSMSGSVGGRLGDALGPGQVEDPAGLPAGRATSASTAASRACCGRAATRSAPARASPTAMARPMPLPAPVTSAVVPVRSNGLHQRRSRVATTSTSSIGLVLAAHRPDERVAAGAEAAVHRPRRRDHRLLAGDDQVAGLVGPAHQVHHPMRRPAGRSRSRPRSAGRGRGTAWCSTCCRGSSTVTPSTSSQLRMPPAWMYL